jgi:glutathione peroxidase
MKTLLPAAAFLLFSLMSSPAADLSEMKINALDGTPFDMAALKGKTVLFVNVASRCGFTKQYAGLETLYAELKDKGLVIVGVPSNDFGGQEPGSAEEIATFCKSTYDVTFPMTEKIAVKGAAKHPLYVFLTDGRGEPKWNFHKYLVNSQGAVVGEFPSSVAPESPKLREAIDAAMAGGVQ